MHSGLRRATLPLLLFALLPGCGSDAETAPVEAAATRAGDPLADIPLEELYGASPVDNLWSPLVEMEIASLPAGWDGVRVAVISDLQLGSWEQNPEVAEAAARRAAQASPDLIALLGDYSARALDEGVLRRVLEPLRGQNVLAVLGDRDVRSDSIRARTVALLQEVGAQVLVNQSTAIAINGDTAFVGGLDPELIQESGADIEWILQTVGPAGRTPLLLTHDPRLAMRGDNQGIGLVLAGNALCGEVEVAGTPRLSWLRGEAMPALAVEGQERLFYREGTVVFVTCGVGYGYLPLRFGAAPEVPIVTLRSRDRGAPEEAGEGDLPLINPADSAVAAGAQPPPD